MNITWEKLASNHGFVNIKIKREAKEVYLHSKYNPIKEAQQWVSGWREFITEKTKRLVVVGIGLGYHILELEKEFPDKEIVVWEFNYNFYNWLQNEKLLFLPENIRVYCNNDLKAIKKYFIEQIMNPETQILVHQNSLFLLPEDLSFIKQNLENYLLNLRAFKNQKQLLLDNFRNNLNLNDSGIKDSKEIVYGKPFLLISAGPSLNKQLPVIKKISDTGTIGIAAVGTAFKVLLHSDIHPDLIMISDPNPQIAHQLETELNFLFPPLFYLSTANHKAVANYSGTRYIVWQKGFELAETEAQKRHEPLVMTGGSVATCLLDLLIKLGAASVGLVGQDLAFTNGFSHAVGAPAARKIVENDDGLIWVDDFYLESKVPTSLNLYSYLKWFENYAEEFQNKEVLWNCTEGGAHIPGWYHGTLISYLEFALRR